MEIIIDIPQEFEEHFNQDKFKDSIGRIAADLISQVYEEDFSISGNYEIELLEMLSEAFEKAENIHSTCVLEGKPIYNDVPAQQGKWIEHNFDETKDRLDYELPYECSECHGRQGILPFNYCPNCGADMRNKKEQNENES